jgi:hypothetical protein
MPKTVTPLEIVKFYFFWKWEYERRNKDYKRDFNGLIALAEKIIRGSQLRQKKFLLQTQTTGRGTIITRKKTGGGDFLALRDRDNVIDRLERDNIYPHYIYKIRNRKMRTAIKRFREKYQRWPKNPEYGCGADDIVKFIINHRGEEPLSKPFNTIAFLLEHIFDYGIFPYEPFSDYGIDYEPFIKPVVEIKSWDASQKKLLVEIDLTKPLPTIHQNISTLYLTYQKDYSGSKHLTADDFTPLIKHLSEIIEESFVKERDLKHFRKEYNPRAAGLLLWDHMQKNPGSTIEGAIDALSAHLGNLGYSQQIAKSGKSEDHRQFRRYLQITEACITQRKISPIGSVDGKEKSQNK